MKETRFRILLGYLNLEANIKNQAILEYFDQQNEEEYTIGGTLYFVLDIYDVKELLREQYKENCKEFENSVYPFSSVITSLIDFDYIVEELLADFAYDDVEGYSLEDKVGDNYIYTEI